MKTTDYIAKALEATNTNEPALARLLGIDYSALQNYRHARRVMDPYTAAKLAEVLKLNPMEVIAAAEAERAKDDERRAYWQKWLKKYARHAPVGLLAIVGLAYVMTTASTSGADGTMLLAFLGGICNNDYAH